ncbi:hypothetical protein IFM89_029740 [Coptis chinensis]|uniref:Polygalacturonase n=1 Tax=Coptis chinensis TaxID=261450 RepID=A0A835M003_9MAGN|nr:hypothetical protein IFM89_029740 [Coptis chinensis]
MVSSLIHHHRVLLVFFSALAANANIEVFDVRKFEAVGDGKTDCSKAFLQAFEMACAWEGDAVVYIPLGTYYEGLTIFNAQNNRCTGDDGISLSPSSEDIYIANLTCGPGHGIGVGSLGGLLHEQNVKGVVYSSNVQINNVHYRNIWGTSTTKLAVNFVCSQIVPCQELELKEINLKYNGKDGPVAASCSNARGVTVDQGNP